MERTFDRKIQFDERSRSFPIRSLVTPSMKPRSYTWACPVWLDQGQEGACVGFSICQEAAAKPVKVPNVTNLTAIDLYNRARQLDEWPGEDYDGTSVLAGIKAAKERGWYEEYRWSFSLADLILAVGHHGPAVLGLWWHEDMMEPDANGRIYPTGEIAGGHAILCNGVNINKRQFRLHNSWGKDWGINGECFISFDALDSLLADEGEACIPLKRHL